MQNAYPTSLVLKLTGATANQLKYWRKTGLVFPVRRGRLCLYSLKDIIKLQVLRSLKHRGLSLQKVREGMRNLSQILPEEEEPLARLIIYTDGTDMIVSEKGKYFSAITRQQYFRFDTEKISGAVESLQKRSNKLRMSSRIPKEEERDRAAL